MRIMITPTGSRSLTTEMKVMKRNVFAYVASIALIAFGASCSSESDLEIKEQKAKTSLSSNMELELNLPEGESPRALNYVLADNPGKGYFKPELKLEEGTTMKVLTIIRNSAGVSVANPVIIQELDWTVSSGKLVAESLPLDLPAGTDLDVNPGTWHMYCIVGATYNPADHSASFASSSQMTKLSTTGVVTSVDALYTNKEGWTPLEVRVARDGVKYFGATRSTTLKSQGSMLLLSFVADVRNGAEYSIEATSLRGNMLSFAGKYSSLNTLEVGQNPRYEAAPPSNYSRYFRTVLSTPEPLAVGRKAATYMTYAVPVKQIQSPDRDRLRVRPNIVRESEYAYSIESVYDVQMEAGHFYHIQVPLKVIISI